MDFRSLLSLSCLGLLLGGCSSSSTPDAADAARDARPSDATVDAGNDASDASDANNATDVTDAAADVSFPVFSLDAGSTWTALYRDYFGSATGVASCAGNGDCHGNMSQAGYFESSFLCPPLDQTGCYQGITSPADGGAGLITPGLTFSQDYLGMVLRQEDGGGGDMPRYPDYTFTKVDVERISGWIEAGAPNN